MAWPRTRPAARPGSDGDHVRAARQHGAIVSAVADDVDRGLIRAQRFLGAQRGLHRLIEPGRFQPLGKPLMRAGDEPRRDRRAQQRPHQHRRPLCRHIALVIKQDGGSVHVRPVDHCPGPPTRRVSRRDRPAGAAAQLRQQPVHLLQPHRRDIPHLPPSPARGSAPASPAPHDRHSAGGSAFSARSGSRAAPARPPGGPAAHRACAWATAPAATPAAPPSGAPWPPAAPSTAGRRILLSIPRRRSSSATRNSSRRITSAWRASQPPAPRAAPRSRCPWPPPPPAAGHSPHAARPPHPGGQMDHLAQATTDHNMQYVIKSTHRADSTHATAPPRPSCRP